MKYLTILILFFFLVINCKTTKNSNSLEDKVERFQPPGTKQVEENLYVDKKEISICGYALYLQWTQIVYGEESIDYKKALPDSSIITQNMIDSPKVCELPIIGISYKQAKEYTEWRTNRVAEMHLIKHKRIKINKKYTPETQFTIQKYLADEFEFATKREKINYFPMYTIPYEDEWKNYIYKGIVDSLITKAPSVLEIVVVRDELKNQSTNHAIQTDTSIDSTVTFINRPVGEGNDYTSFRNICRWKHFN